MAQSLEPFFGSVEEPLRGAAESANPGSARGLSLLEFVQGLEDYIVTLAKQGIDTKEERDAIVASIMSSYDTYIAPRLGPLMSRIVRKNLKAILDDALEALGKP